MTSRPEITRSRPFLPTVASDWLIVAILLLTILALWLPFGLNVGFVGDDWYFYRDAQFRYQFGFYDFPIMTTSRPLATVAYIAGYMLSPGHFAGFNLALIILLFARSSLVYAIFRRLGAGQIFAFAVASLTSFDPADTGIFYLGALNVYLAWDAYLLAFYLLLLSWRRPLAITIPLMVLSCGAQIICFGIYEAAYPLILVSPLALLLLKRASLRRWMPILFVWYLIPVLNLFRVVALLQSRPGALQYQSGLVNSSMSLTSLLTNLAQVLQRHFALGWVEHDLTSHYEIIAIAVGVLVFGVCWQAARHEHPRTPRLYLAYAVAGLVIVALGVLAYLPTSLASETVRTLFGSSIGAGLALAAALRLISRHALVFALLVGIVTGLGCAQLLEQHARYFEQSEAQQALIIRLTDRIPAVESPAALLVMDETPDRELLRVFDGYWHFGIPFALVYPFTALSVALCYPDDTSQNPEAYCLFHDDSVEARITPVIVWTQPYEQVILVRYTADREFIVAPDLAPYGHSPAYRPQLLIRSDRPPQEIIQNLKAGSN